MVVSQYLGETLFYCFRCLFILILPTQLQTKTIYQVQISPHPRLTTCTLDSCQARNVYELCWHEGNLIFYPQEQYGHHLSLALEKIRGSQMHGLKAVRWYHSGFSQNILDSGIDTKYNVSVSTAHALFQL